MSTQAVKTSSPAPRLLALAAAAASLALTLCACQASPATAPGTLQNYARDFTQVATKGLPPGVACMIGTITPDGHATYYKAGPGGTLTVPNGTSHPYVARCINGAITAQPGSGDLPS